MPTKRSASSSSRPRPNWSAYSSARSRLSRPARIDSASTSESSRRVSGPRSRRATFAPSGSGRPVSSSHHSPRSTTLCSPAAAYVSCPSWMSSPASALPDRTSSMIWSNGTSRQRYSPSRSWSVRNAVVIRPGTAISTRRRSSSSSSSRATTIGPYPEPMLAPCGNSTYLSCTCGYACSEIAVTSSRPSSAHSFSVWMSWSTCSNSKPRGSTSPLARPQNMKASSGSGLWPRRINKAARAYLPKNQRSSGPSSSLRVNGLMCSGRPSSSDTRASSSRIPFACSSTSSSSWPSKT